MAKKASHMQAPTLEYGYPMASREMKIEASQYIRDWLLEERSQDTEGNILRNLDCI